MKKIKLLYGRMIGAYVKENGCTLNKYTGEVLHYKGHYTTTPLHPRKTKKEYSKPKINTQKRLHRHIKRVIGMAANYLQDKLPQKDPVLTMLNETIKVIDDAKW